MNHAFRKTRVLGLVIVMLCFAMPTSAQDKEADTDAERTKLLIGKWTVKQAPKEKVPPDTVVEFTKAGKLIFTATVEGMKVMVQGTYKVENGVLVSTHPGPGDTTRTEKNKIVKLDAKEFVFIDEEDKVVLVRKK